MKDKGYYFVHKLLDRNNSKYGHMVKNYYAYVNELDHPSNMIYVDPIEIRVMLFYRPGIGY